MPDWPTEIELRLASLRLKAGREAEIIDELSEHLELRYAEFRNRGVDEAEAFALVRAELLDEKALASYLPARRAATIDPNQTLKAE